MVAALGCVDYVFISDIDTSHHDILSVVQPNSVVFGIEDTESWRITATKREQFIRSTFPNIKVKYLERFSDTTISTSGLIQKIVKLCTA